MPSFIKLYKELDGFYNACNELSLAYCNSINLMRIDNKKANNTNNSVNELYLISMFSKEIKYKISCSNNKRDVPCFFTLRKN
jgi:hypothetical protein